MSILSEPHFHNEEAAFARLESIVWPDGPVCPRCKGTERVTKVRGKTARAGLWRCGPCKRQFRVTVGTVFEDSHIPLHKWFQAAHLMASSKKGFSAHQMHRTLGITYKSAWFMAHRIREAMRSGTFAPMGGAGGIVEVDETYIGFKGGYDARTGRGAPHKNTVLTLVSRDGEARSFHIDRANQRTVLPIIRQNLDAEARIVTDDAGFYRNLDAEYLHAFVDHSKKQWGRGEIHTNTIEGFFSIFKRGMKGVYQHCSEKHLHRYLAEFDFRYSNRAALGVNDAERADRALAGVKGKRLYYRQPA